MSSNGFHEFRVHICPKRTYAGIVRMACAVLKIWGSKDRTRAVQNNAAAL